MSDDAVDLRTAPIGTRVEPSPLGILAVLHSHNRGTIVGRSRTPDLIRVRKDGTKTPHTYHHSYWQPERP